MKSIQTEETNYILQGEGCVDLPVRKVVTHEGIPIIETIWELSEQEIQNIIDTKRMYIYFVGETITPVLPSTEQLI